jgi:hypothetical protein
MVTQTKMLQILIDGQKSIGDDIKKLDKKIDGVEERLTRRIDKIGLGVARLEDDPPTIKEFDKLEKRVTKLETRFVKN